jgi:tetratricopeptide (TPR) repeat protein
MEDLESDSSVWNHIGLVYWEMQEYQKAIRYFGQSIKEAKDSNRRAADFKLVVA